MQSRTRSTRIEKDLERNYVAAAANMQRSLDTLRPALAALPIPVSAEMIQGVVATEDAWRAMEAEFGLLTGAEIAVLAGSKARVPNGYARDKRKAGKLIGVQRRNTILYPGFQVNLTTGKERDAIPRLITVIREHGRSEEDLAQWLCDPSGYLGGDRPVDHLDDPDKVVAAAEGHYGVEW